jgi:hypothetical protein
VFNGSLLHGAMRETSGPGALKIASTGIINAGLEMKSLRNTSILPQPSFHFSSILQGGYRIGRLLRRRKRAHPVNTHNCDQLTAVGQALNYLYTFLSFLNIDRQSPFAVHLLTTNTEAHYFHLITL